jgi:hypothetical protein
MQVKGYAAPEPKAAFEQARLFMERACPRNAFDNRGPRMRCGAEPIYTFPVFQQMNRQAEACLRMALKYERAAEFAADAPVRRMYLDLARQWHDWAEQAERQAGKDLPLSAA